MQNPELFYIHSIGINEGKCGPGQLHKNIDLFQEGVTVQKGKYVGGYCIPPTTIYLTSSYFYIQILAKYWCRISFQDLTLLNLLKEKQKTHFYLFIPRIHVRYMKKNNIYLLSFFQSFHNFTFL